ncbi:MAG: sensor of ECF-type sigma factor [Bacteroidota bacterium]
MKYILLIALMLTGVVYAQEGDKIKAFKRAHITDALELTSGEAERFWPVYNAHEDKMTALRKKERREIFQIVKGDLNGISDEEANMLIEKSLQFKEKEMQENRSFVSELKNVIPPQKILKLHRAEEEFKRMLLQRMKNRQNRRNKN